MPPCPGPAPGRFPKTRKEGIPQKEVACERAQPKDFPENKKSEARPEVQARRRRENFGPF